MGRQKESFLFKMYVFLILIIMGCGGVALCCIRTIEEEAGAEAHEIYGSLLRRSFTARELISWLIAAVVEAHMPSIILAYC